MSQRMPVQYRLRERDAWAGCPRSVAWAVVQPHAKRAMRNHGQSLERLAERGGLGPSELYALVHDLPCGSVTLSQGELAAWLRTLEEPDA